MISAYSFHFCPTLLRVPSLLAKSHRRESNNFLHSLYVFYLFMRRDGMLLHNSPSSPQNTLRWGSFVLLSSVTLHFSAAAAAVVFYQSHCIHCLRRELLPRKPWRFVESWIFRSHMTARVSKRNFLVVQNFFPGPFLLVTLFSSHSVFSNVNNNQPIREAWSTWLQTTSCVKIQSSIFCRDGLCREWFPWVCRWSEQTAVVPHCKPRHQVRPKATRIFSVDERMLSGVPSTSFYWRIIRRASADLRDRLFFPRQFSLPRSCHSYVV